MPCVKVAAFARNKSRNVPPYHAKDCLKKTKRGADGQLYLAKKVRGVCRWILVEDDDDEDVEEMTVYRKPKRTVVRRTTVVTVPARRTVVARSSARKARATRVVYLEPSPSVRVLAHHPLLHPVLHPLLHRFYGIRSNSDAHMQHSGDRVMTGHSSGIASNRPEYRNAAGKTVRDMGV